MYIHYMAKPFVEVFKYEEMVEGKCYAQGNYTHDMCNDHNKRYFFKGQPTYVGKLLRKHREGVAHGVMTWTTFIKDGKETDIHHNEDGSTAFAEVPCVETKGGRRTTLRKRRKNRRTKYRR
jgi:hypothetical protein